MPQPSIEFTCISPLIPECSECRQQFNASGGGEALIAELARHMLDSHPKDANKAESESANEASRLLYDIRTRGLL